MPVLLDATTVERIYAGALADAPWQDAVDMLCDALGGVIVALAFRTVREGMPSVGVQAFRGNGRRMWDGFFEQYSKVETFPYDRMEPGVIYPLDQFAGQDAPELERLRTDLQQPLGGGETYGLALWDGGHPVAYLIWVTPAGHPLTPEQARWVKAVAGPLSRAVGGYHRMRVAELSGRLTGDALGRLEVGVVAIDAQGRILFHNAIARDLIAQCSDMGMHGGRLVMTRPDLASRLEASRTVPQAAQVAGRGGVRIGLMMVPVADGRDELGPGSRPERAIYLHDIARSAPVPERLIAELFGLSRAESRLAALLCMGQTLREAAQEMHITENSARTYSKLAFSKLGVSRQAELVRRVLSSVAIFGNIGAD